MRFLFVDESGDTAPLKIGDLKSQPVLAVVGLVVDQQKTEKLTRAWVDLKRRFFPQLCKGNNTWDWHTVEVKGTVIRAAIRSSKRNERRGAIGFLDRTFDLLERFDAHLCARVFVKQPGGKFDGVAVYTSAMQRLCRYFQSHLDATGHNGLVIADSRMPGPNINVSHSVFTQKYSAQGDPYPRLLEPPLFGHSDNHAGLQIADVIASAILVPTVIAHCVEGKLNSAHCHGSYQSIAQRFVPKMRRLELPSGTVATHTIAIADPISKQGIESLYAKYPDCLNSHEPGLFDQSNTPFGS